MLLALSTACSKEEAPSPVVFIVESMPWGHTLYYP